MKLSLLVLIFFIAACNISNEGGININSNSSKSNSTNSNNDNSGSNNSSSSGSNVLSVSSPANGSIVGTKSVEVSGTFTSGSSVTVSSASSSCTTTVGSDGNFSCMLSPELPAGNNTITVSSDGVSDVSLSIEVGYPDLCSVPADKVGRVFFNFANDCQFYASVDNGWMLWLQYYHQGGTQPASNIIANCNDLPIDDTSLTLGTNHSGDLTKWGHGSQAFAQQIPDTNIKLRWYGKTSHHSRVIHFETPVLGQFRDPAASSFGPGGISSNFTALSGHTAFLPQYASASHTGGNGDNVFSDTPLWDNHSSGQNAHWSVNDSLGRWYVDSRDTSNYGTHTIHKIWVSCNY